MLRFAPSATKDINIEDLRVLLLNHIVSKQRNDQLLIKIDDSNKKHNEEDKEKAILEILALFSIDYTGVVSQSQNIKYHTQMAMKLLLEKKAFNCFCSQEALDKDKQKAKKEGKPYSYSGFCQTISDETKFNCNAPFVVRLAKPNHAITFTDSLKGDCSYQPDEVDSFVILKHDKSPTSGFASAIDDMLYDISTIIRSDKNLDDTPKQIHIRESLGYDKEIQYIHIPTLSNCNNENCFLVKELIDEGYLPVAIANYCISLGYDTPKEIFTLEEALEWFDINKISKESVEFDIEKLNSINNKHLKTMDELRLSKILGYADTDIGILAKIYLEECNTTKELKEKLVAMFKAKIALENFEEESKQLKDCLKVAPFIDDLDNLKTYITNKTNLKGEKLLTPLYYAITGATNGPDLNKIYPLIKNYLGEIIQ